MTSSIKSYSPDIKIHIATHGEWASSEQKLSSVCVTAIEKCVIYLEEQSEEELEVFCPCPLKF